jgi:hypothetical protein
MIAGLAAIALSSMAYGQALRVGTELQANTDAISVEPVPLVAAGTSGDFVVVWVGDRQDDSLHAIFGRRFSSEGAAVGSEFQINTTPVGSEPEPDVAANAAGDFVAVWTAAAGPEPATFARRFSSSGAGLGTEFRVDSYALGSGASEPAVAADADGNFLVAWSDLGINGRRFDSIGAPLGEQFRISATLTSGETGPEVAADGSGNFIIVWLDDGEAIEGRRFAGDGSALGTEFQVQAVPYVEYGPAIELDGPVIAAGAAGSFVVAWERYAEAASDSGSARSDIFVRAFDGAGNPRGGGFKITGAPHYEYNPSIAASPSDEFIVAWDGYREGGGSFDVYAQRLGAHGDPVGGTLRANSTVAGDQTVPNAVFSSPGELVLVWSQDAPPGLARDVRGQAFTTKLTTPICHEGSLARRIQIKLGKLGAPAGDETLLVKGTLSFPPGIPASFDPTNAGAQILVEDLGAGNASLFELSQRTRPVPGGGGCAPNDGWKANASGSTHAYKNKSGALPPACVAGSTNGLAVIKLKDKRDGRGEIVFKLKAKRSTIAAPVGPLRVSIVFGAGSIESAAGECGGMPFAAEECAASGSTFQCEIGS